jgi:hypothetical protein
MKCGRNSTTEKSVQFSSDAWRYVELTSFFERRRNTKAQQSQPEPETPPAQPKRRFDRRRWSEFSEEERLRWRDRRRGLMRREMGGEYRREMQQLGAVLSDEERRQAKRYRKYVREGAKIIFSDTSTKDSIEITIFPHQKNKK